MSKHLLLCIFLSVLSPFIGVSQDRVPSQFEIDSLALQDIRLEAWDALQSRKTTAGSLLEEMKQEALRLDIPYYLCKYYDYNSFYCMSQDDVEGSILSSLKAREIATNIKDRGLITSCILNLAVNLENIGLKEYAAKSFEECRQHFKELGENDGLEITYVNLLAVHAELDQLDIALQWADSLVNHEKRTGVSHYPSQLMKSSILLELGRYDEALALAKACLAAQKKEPTYQFGPNDYNIIADIYSRIGDKENARIYLEKARDMYAHQTGDRDSKVGLTVEAGILYQEGEFEASFYRVEKLKNLIDSLDKVTDYVAIEKAMSIMAQTSKEEILNRKQALMSKMQTKDALYANMFRSIAIPISILIGGFIFLHGFTRRKNKKLDLVKAQVLHQDRKINDSIAYGKNIQEALFRKATLGDGTQSAVQQWQQSNLSTSQVCSWNYQMKVGSLLCFFHPSTDVVSSAFYAIICHGAFKKVVAKWDQAGVKPDLQIMHSEILLGVKKRLKSKEIASSIISLLHLESDTNRLYAYDGVELKEEDFDESVTEELTIHDLKISHNENEVLVYTKEVADLLAQHGTEMLNYNWANDVFGSAKKNEEVHEAQNKLEGDYLLVKISKNKEQ